MPSIFASYALGVNVATSPRLLRDGEVAMLINGTVSSGHASPRPPFIEIPTARQNERDPDMSIAMPQGMAYYDSEHGLALILAADGRLFHLDIETQVITSLTRLPVFDARRPKVFFCQRGSFMIAQDGINPPVIIRGLTATQGTDPSIGVPCGTFMADGWGRLAVASPCRTRVYFSNHLADPGAIDLPIDPMLAFTEGTEYFKNIRYFQLPQSSGRITAMTFTPSLNGDGDLGPLAVFCERATWLYNVRVPREQWGEQDIATNPLPHIGCIGADAFAVRGNDVLFSDQSGRIQQMRVAIRRNDDARLRQHDAAVWPILASCHASQQHRRIAVHWRARHTLITVRPEIVHYPGGRHTVRHRAILALNESPALENDPTWDGLWTGVQPTAMCTGRWQGIETVFIWSLDLDGRGRIYRIGESGDDQSANGPRRRPMRLVTRADLMEDPFKVKSFNAASIRLDHVHGNVNLDGEWIADNATPFPWFNRQIHIPDGLTRVGFAQPQTLTRIHPPIPSRGYQFTDCALAITVTGQASIAECAVDAIAQASPSNPGPPSIIQCSAAASCPPDAEHYAIYPRPS